MQVDNSWKCAILWPLIKKVERQGVSQKYRHVSNLSFISKLVEKSVQDQYIHQCDISGLISNFQSAYKWGHSCKTALLKILNDLLWSMERQSVTALVLLDLSAAFDTVSHTLLLKVLEYNLESKVLHSSGLMNIWNLGRVCVNDKSSTDKNINFSVPQGLINVIDTKIVVNAFADDHSLQNDFQNESKMVKLLEIN